MFSYFEPNFIEKFLWKSGFSKFGQNRNYTKNRLFGRHFETVLHSNSMELSLGHQREWKYLGHLRVKSDSYKVTLAIKMRYNKIHTHGPVCLEHWTMLLMLHVWPSFLSLLHWPIDSVAIWIGSSQVIIDHNENLWWLIVPSLFWFIVYIYISNVIKRPSSINNIMPRIWYFFTTEDN